MASLDGFLESLKTDDALADLRAGVIGEGVTIDGPFGPTPLVYADYVASGRALRQVERFVAEEVLPFYANTHTEASFCGAATSRLRDAARKVIARRTGPGADCAVIFAGSGATAGVNRIVGLLEIPARSARGERIRVVHGPYEHHSNLLPWRESGAETVEIAEAAGGGVDLAALEAALSEAEGYDLVVGAFSAASNVTGVLTDVDAVTRLLKRHGALSVWDYAGGAPYLAMGMTPDADCAKDAIVFSPHKFPGGPGASGVLVARQTLVAAARPTCPGGGTVAFVSPWTQVYSESLVAREEAGTPNIIGDIRAALVMLVQEAVGIEVIAVRDAAFRARALAAWSKVPELEILGDGLTAEALPIFSFRVRDGRGGYVHHQLFVRMLSDLYGVQARGGCACAGPYAHRLLGIDEAGSTRLLSRLEQGFELEKPGWARVGFGALMSDAQADFLIRSVAELARMAAAKAALYEADPATARFRPKAAAVEMEQLAG